MKTPITLIGSGRDYSIFGFACLSVCLRRSSSPYHQAQQGGRSNRSTVGSGSRGLVGQFQARGRNSSNRLGSADPQRCYSSIPPDTPARRSVQQIHRRQRKPRLGRPVSSLLKKKQQPIGQRSSKEMISPVPQVLQAGRSSISTASSGNRGTRPARSEATRRAPAIKPHTAVGKTNKQPSRNLVPAVERLD